MLTNFCHASDQKSKKHSWPLLTALGFKKTSTPVQNPLTPALPKNDSDEWNVITHDQIDGQKRTPSPVETDHERDGSIIDLPSNMDTTLSKGSQLSDLLRIDIMSPPTPLRSTSKESSISSKTVQTASPQTTPPNSPLARVIQHMMTAGNIQDSTPPAAVFDQESINTQTLPVNMMELDRNSSQSPIPSPINQEPSFWNLMRQGCCSCLPSIQQQVQDSKKKSSSLDSQKIITDLNNSTTKPFDDGQYF